MCPQKGESMARREIPTDVAGTGATVRELTNANFQELFPITEDVIINVHADGNSNGDMNINEALDFVKTYGRASPSNMLGFDFIGLGLLYRAPGIYLELMAGTHTLTEENSRIAGINTRLVIRGPQLGGNFEATQATIVPAASPFAGAGTLEVWSCPYFGLLNVRVAGNLYLVDTLMDIGGAADVSAMTQLRDGLHTKVDGMVTVRDGSSIATAASDGAGNLTAGCLQVINNSCCAITRLAIDSSALVALTPLSTHYCPVIEIVNGGKCSVAIVQSLSIVPAVPATPAGIFFVSDCASLFLGGNVSVPNTRPGPAVIVENNATFHIQGNLNWNGRSLVGSTAVSGSMNAAGGIFQVGGTVTP